MLLLLVRVLCLDGNVTHYFAIACRHLAMSQPEKGGHVVLQVKFVADEDVLKHISEDTGMAYSSINGHLVFTVLNQGVRFLSMDFPKQVINEL